MSRLITLALCLLTAPTTAIAAGISPTCVRNGDRIGCAWSEIRTLDLHKMLDPAWSPVPICIDCAPDDQIKLEMTCEIEVASSGAITARCLSDERTTP